jgi:glycosyltransferase involved in cell wall biosynthesis
MEPPRAVKVIHVIARMNVGGPAVLVADLMRNFDSQKVHSILLTGYCDESESDYLDEVARDVSAIRVPGLGRSVSPIKDLSALFVLVKEIRKFQPDVIHTHTAKAGVLGRIAGLIAAPRAKRVHTFHGHLLHGYFGSGKTKLIILVEKLLAHFTVRLIAIGNSVKSDLLEVGIGSEFKYEVIFPGLEPLRIHSKLDARRSLNLESRLTYLVFVGRLTQIKRPDRLLDIARFLSNSYPNSRMLIAGAGELFATIKAKSESEVLPVMFLGWRNDIDLILSASDIAILCSDNEGIPLTLIQAAQAGLPIVSTNVGSVSDIVVHGINGLLTETSSAGLISATKSLLDSVSMRDEFGKAGQKRANKYFTSEAMVKHHERLYSQIV